MTVGDTITVVIFLFVLSVSVLMAVVFLEAFSVMFEGTAGEGALLQTTGAMYAFDTWFPYIMFGLFISVMISSYFVDTNPIFLLFSLGIMILGIIGAGAFTEMFNQYAQHDAFSDVINSFPGMVGMWQYMPTFILFMGVGVVIVLYAKHRRGGFGAPVQ